MFLKKSNWQKVVIGPDDGLHLTGDKLLFEPVITYLTDVYATSGLSVLIIHKSLPFYQVIIIAMSAYEKIPYPGGVKNTYDLASSCHVNFIMKLKALSSLRLIIYKHKSWPQDIEWT